MQTHILDALPIIRSAEVLAGALRKTRPEGGYDDIHSALAQTLELLQQASEVLWPE